MSIVPNSEQVAVTWLKSVTGLSGLVGNNVATRLPAASSWTSAVFATVSAIGGRVDHYSPDRDVLVQVDAWAAAGLSGEVLTTLEVIREACYTGEGLGELAVKAGFASVKLTDVALWSEPVVVHDDPAQLAHARVSLEVCFYVLAA